MGLNPHQFKSGMELNIYVKTVALTFILDRDKGIHLNANTGVHQPVYVNVSVHNYWSISPQTL